MNIYGAMDCPDDTANLGAESNMGRPTQNQTRLFRLHSYLHFGESDVITRLQLMGMVLVQSHHSRVALGTQNARVKGVEVNRTHAAI